MTLIAPAPAKLSTLPVERSYVEQLAARRADSRSAQNQEDFAAAIARQGGAATATGDTQHKTRQIAQDFVAAALVQPILKQLRDSNRAAPPFAPSSGEKSFRQIADSQLARQLVRKAHWGIVDKLAQTLLDKAEGRVAPHPMPRYGPYLDKLRPPSPVDPSNTTHSTDSNDEHATDTIHGSGLDAQA